MKNWLSKTFTRKRLIMWLLFCASVGCVLAAVNAVQSLLAQQVVTEREKAATQVQEFLLQAARITADYQREFMTLHEQTARQLTQNAGALCGELQVFLQAALVGHEAKNLQEQLNALQQKRDRLLILAREQWEMIGGLTTRIRSLEHEKILRQIQADNVALFDAQGNLVIKPPERSPLVPQLFSERQPKILAELSATENAPAIAAQWLENLLNDCSLDFKHLLPKNALLVIAEVGKQVLFTFGKEIDATASGTATMPLLVRSPHRQLVLQVTLYENIAPPTAADLAARLAVRLNAQGQNLRGFIVGAENKMLAVFPESAAKNNLPLPVEKKWVELNNGEVMTYYEALSITDLSAMNALNEPAKNETPWIIGLQITLAQPHQARRFNELIMQNPFNALIFFAAGLLLVLAFVLSAYLSWHAGDNVTVLRNVYAQLEHLRPQLGSLQRLQQANRNHAPASNILRSAKNKVLRDLAARVSPPLNRQAGAGKKLKNYR